MTVREFLLAHPEADVDLRPEDGRVFLDGGARRRLLDGKAVIACRNGARDARYVPADRLLEQEVCSMYQTHGLWRVAAADDPHLAEPARYWPQLKGTMM